MARLAYIKVFPNPYHFIDADGEPAGAFPCDASHTGGALQFVGATIQPVILDKPEVVAVQRRGGDGKLATVTATLKPGREKVRFVFSESEPDMVPNTPYYRQALARREILPADADAARVAGMQFPGIDALRAEERTKAAAHYRAERGEDPAWAKAAVAAPAAKAKN